MSSNLYDSKVLNASTTNAAANKGAFDELELTLGPADVQPAMPGLITDHTFAEKDPDAVDGTLETVGAPAAACDEAEKTAPDAEPAGSASEVPVFRLSDVVTFTGGAAARRRELEAGEPPALAELSTAEASIGASLRISLRLMGDAVRLVRNSEAWSDWSPAARVQRNRMAGQRKIGL